MSCRRRSNLMSGCRRITPVAEQGTSSKIRSNGCAVPPRIRAASASPSINEQTIPTATSSVRHARVAKRRHRSRRVQQFPAAVRANDRSCRPAPRTHRGSARQARGHQMRGELCSRILNRDESVGEPWQRRDIDCVFEQQRLSSNELATTLSPALCEALPILRRRDAQSIDAQPKRRPRIVRVQDRFDLARKICSQRIDEPARMGRAQRRRLHRFAQASHRPRADSAAESHSTGRRHAAFQAHARHSPFPRRPHAQEYRNKAADRGQRSRARESPAPSLLADARAIARAAHRGGCTNECCRRRANGAVRALARFPSRDSASSDRPLDDLRDDLAPPALESPRTSSCAQHGLLETLAAHEFGCARRLYDRRVARASERARLRPSRRECRDRPPSRSCPARADVLSLATSALQTRSCVPLSSVSAIGQGLKARTCRSISFADRVQSMRASSFVIFAA